MVGLAALLLTGCPRGAPPDATPGVPPVAAPAPSPGVPAGVARQAISVHSQAAEPHDAWVDEVRLAVASRWEQELEQTLMFTRLSRPEYTTRVAVVLEPDGALASVTVTESSGVTALDEAVVRAARAAGPLPAPPEGVAALPELSFTVRSERGASRD